MHIVGTGEKARHYLAFQADGHHLAARIQQLVRVVWQQVEIQSVPGELPSIERAHASTDGDVPRRQLRRR